MTQTTLCYPHPANLGLHRPPLTGIHTTDGLPGNYALDFMAPGGTPFLAPQGGTVTRISGHRVLDYVLGSSIMGRSVYLRTTGGVVYFATHLADDVLDYCHAGLQVRIGQRLGTVAHWPHDPGRSHTHLGVTHPMGRTAAIGRIRAVARAMMRPLPRPPL